jgi:hypothetical protein
VSELGTIKGNAFREFLVWFGRARGDERLRAARDLLPEPLARQLEPDRPALGVLASSRYEAELVHALLDALTAGASDHEVDELVRDGARATIDAMMQGVQRTAFRLLVSPTRYPKVVNLLWELNYDSGRVEVVPIAPYEHQGTVIGWRAHHRLICRINHQAKLRLYETMRCRDVVVDQTHCVSLGHEVCRSTVRWR